MFGHFALSWSFKTLSRSETFKPLKPLQNGFFIFFVSFIGFGHLHQEGQNFCVQVPDLISSLRLSTLTDYHCSIQTGGRQPLHKPDAIQGSQGGYSHCTDERQRGQYQVTLSHVIEHVLSRELLMEEEEYRPFNSLPHG